VILEILTLSNNLTFNFCSDIGWTNIGKTGLSSLGTHLFSSQLGGHPLFVERFFKKAPGVDYFMDGAKQMLFE
jgi:hypothetical protein